MNVGRDLSIRDGFDFDGFLEQSTVSEVDLDNDVVHRTEYEFDLVRVLFHGKGKDQCPLRSQQLGGDEIRTVAHVK